MAKTKTKSKGSGLTVRRITSKKERKSGNLFTRLKTDEWFKAYALFSPDPEADKNPFWFEYLEHYDNANNQYVPCTEDDYLCEMGENPSGRALTLWYFPDNPEKDRFKVFKLNGYLIRDFQEIEDEEGGVFGRRFRLKRLSDRGEYRVSGQQDKPLTKKEIATFLKEAGENIDFEKIILNQAKDAIKRAAAVNAMTEEDEEEIDDDEDEDEDEPKSRRGKEKSKKDSKAKSEEEDDDEDEEDDEDEDEDEDDEDESDDDDDDDDDEEDEEEEESDEDDEDEEEDDDEEDEEDESEMSGVKLTVTSTSEKDEIISAKVDGKATKLYVGQGLDVDWDMVKKGVEITVDAKKDDEGDWVLTAVKAKKAKAAAGKGKKGSKTKK